MSNLLVLFFSYLCHPTISASPLSPIFSLLPPSLLGLKPVFAYGNISECGFLHMPPSAGCRERSGATINPGMSLRWGDLLHTALHLTSILSHSLSLSELGIISMPYQDVQIEKKNLPPLTVIKVILSQLYHLHLQIHS